MLTEKTRTSTLYGFGSNGSGQLGLGHLDDVTTPDLVSPGDIKRIVAGGNHTLILDKLGSVIAMGNNMDGRCCFRGEDAITNPTIIKPPSNKLWIPNMQYLDVSATWSASIFLTKEGDVKVCGSGEHGELGLGQGVTEFEALIKTVPHFPPPDTKVVQLAACMAHTVAVLNNGEAWGWGNGRKGQLGEPAVEVWEPRKIEGLGFFAVKAVCGKDFTCIVGEQESGKLTLLGPNARDRFGVRESAPKAIPGWKDISASWGSVFVLKKDGSLTAWGRNDHGQLPPDGLPPLDCIAAGSEHCVALTKTGKVLTWGWGEHGNCGGPTDEQGDVKGRWNEIETSHKCTDVFAGCATSFFVMQDG